MWHMIPGPPCNSTWVGGCVYVFVYVCVCVCVDGCRCGWVGGCGERVVVSGGLLKRVLVK